MGPMMGGARLWLVRVLAYLTNHVVSHVPSHALRRAWYRRLGLKIGQGSGIHLGCFLWFYGPGQITAAGSAIGRNTRVNRNCCLDVRGSLTIGNYVSISPEVAIITTQHDWRHPGFELESRPVIIEDHVWIGIRAIILPGTRVGRGAVVAAGAVVSGDIPPLAVVAGVPGQVIATRPEEALDYDLAAPFPLYE